MGENTTKRREWVKNAAIIFLTVMLILTFFSNTIMNYSLPEVATLYVTSGTITAKIRGTGVVESVDPYQIEVTESRKVKSVAVKVGDMVEKGDVLYYLDDKESDELKAAREALEAAEDSYDKILLSDSTTANVINESNQNISVTEYRNRITNAQNELDVAQKKVNELEKKYNDLDLQIAATPSNVADTTNETKAYNTAKTNLDNADFALTAAQNKYDDIVRKIATQESISSGDTEAVVSALEQQRVAAKAELDNAMTAQANAALAFSQAETALENKKKTGDTSGIIQSLTNQKNSVNVELNTAKEKLTNAQNNLSELVGNIDQILVLQDAYDAISKAREEVEELESKMIGATIDAEITGTVTALNLTAGQTTNPSSPVAVIQPADKGYSLSFSVTNDQAKRLSKGDVAEVVNSWRYDDINVVLESIKNDPTNPGQSKILNFNVTGDVTPGESMSVSVGQKSASYDLIVPNSAIREDNNGKFILIVESKSGPINNRYIATRVDVEVLASDDTQTAVSAALYGYEFVITTSTKPVEAGKQVRLAEN